MIAEENILPEPTDDGGDGACAGAGVKGDVRGGVEEVEALIVVLVLRFGLNAFSSMSSVRRGKRLRGNRYFFRLFVRVSQKN